MDVREKLVELANDVLRYLPWGEIQKDTAKRIAERMIANGVTVQECGEWVYDRWCEFKCSVCGQFSNSKPYKGKENYCPHCGAKMMPQPPKGE